MIESSLFSSFLLDGKETVPRASSSTDLPFHYPFVNTGFIS